MQLEPGRQGAAVRQRPQAHDHRRARRDRGARSSTRRAAPTCCSRSASTYATARGAHRRSTTETRARDPRARPSEMSGQALRVLGRRAARPRSAPRPASRRRHAEHDLTAPSCEIEKRLTFLGLVGMIDPPREGVKEAVAPLRRGARARRDDHGRPQADRGRHRARSSASGKTGAIALTGAELEKLDATTGARRVHRPRARLRARHGRAEAPHRAAPSSARATSSR